MLEALLRKNFDRYLVNAFVQRLSLYAVVTPIRLTLLGALCGVGVFGALINGKTFCAIALLALSGYLDVLDGSLARYQKVDSPIGAVLDIVSDRFVEWSIILALFWVSPSRGLLCLLMLGSILLCVTSFLVVGIFSPNHSDKSFHYSPGLIERAEAFLFFAAMIVWPAQFTFLASLFTCLVFLTTFLRVKEFCSLIHLR